MVIFWIGHSRESFFDQHFPSAYPYTTTDLLLITYCTQRDNRGVQFTTLVLQLQQYFTASSQICTRNGKHETLKKIQKIGILKAE